MTVVMATAVDVEEFNQLPEAEAIELLMNCARVQWWADELVARRPFGRRNELLSTASDLTGLWSWADVMEALVGYCRFGSPLDGGGDARLSRAEQAGVGDTIAGELRAVSDAYQQRFGREFVVRTTERSASEILRIGYRRLRLDEQADRAATTLELRDIARRRLNALIG
ncbi:MAG: 2-oxo-4-hydroxy-4-carboxy-5-ureidoimidazoline decarboxylase [Micropruina sp.]|uniref:2-oxo-4-hydroxy-4-carboxy-5-ureidoimidazoline decarboxylase n=1 Tax=Micropruina sp. TaxID=2737536 RepID=UPI0039E556CA